MNSLFGRIVAAISTARPAVRVSISGRTNALHTIRGLDYDSFLAATAYCNGYQDSPRLAILRIHLGGWRVAEILREFFIPRDGLKVLALGCAIISSFAYLFADNLFYAVYQVQSSGILSLASGLSIGLYYYWIRSSHRGGHFLNSVVENAEIVHFLDIVVVCIVAGVWWHYLEKLTPYALATTVTLLIISSACLAFVIAHNRICHLVIIFFATQDDDGTKQICLDKFDGLPSESVTLLVLQAGNYLDQIDYNEFDGASASARPTTWLTLNSSDVGIGTLLAKFGSQSPSIKCTRHGRIRFSKNNQITILSIARYALYRYLHGPTETGANPESSHYRHLLKSASLYFTYKLHMTQLKAYALLIALALLITADYVISKDSLKSGYPEVKLQQRDGQHGRRGGIDIQLEGRFNVAAEPPKDQKRVALAGLSFVWVVWAFYLRRLQMIAMRHWDNQIRATAANHTWRLFRRNVSKTLGPGTLDEVPRSDVLHGITNFGVNSGEIVHFVDAVFLAIYLEFLHLLYF